MGSTATVVKPSVHSPTQTGRKEDENAERKEKYDFQLPYCSVMSMQNYDFFIAFTIPKSNDS